MLEGRKLLLLFVLVVFTLLLRDLPYVNVTFISRMWLIYFALLLFIIFASIKFRAGVLWFAIFLLFAAAFVLTLMRLPFFAESIGAVIYFFLWAILIHKLVGFVKGRQ